MNGRRPRLSLIVHLILPKELLSGSLRTKKQPFSPAWQGFLSPCHQIRETVVLFLHIMCLRFSNHYQKEIKAVNISLRLRKWEVCTRTFLNGMYESGYLPPLGKPQNLNRVAQKCIFFTHTNCDVSWEALFSGIHAVLTYGQFSKCGLLSHKKVGQRREGVMNGAGTPGFNYLRPHLRLIARTHWPKWVTCSYPTVR